MIFKLSHVALICERPIQTKHGLITGTLTDKGGWSLFFLSKLGIVEVQHEKWPGPVGLPLSVCAITPVEPFRAPPSPPKP